MLHALTTLLARRPAAADLAAPLASRASRGIADRHNPGVRQIVVRLDVPTFERVAALAGASDITTSEAVRQLIRRGLGNPGSLQP